MHAWLSLNGSNVNTNEQISRKFPKRTNIKHTALQKLQKVTKAIVGRQYWKFGRKETVEKCSSLVCRSRTGDAMAAVSAATKRIPPGGFFSWDHHGIEIRFPFQPYPCQERYTNAVVEAVILAQNALLESPTGTGKTAALLAGAIAATRGVGAAAGTASSTGGLRERGTGGRVIYASRTHSQLSQVVGQLRRMPLPPGLKSVVLGSRDQLCIHPKVLSISAENLSPFENLILTIIMSSDQQHFIKHNGLEDKSGGSSHDLI